jgi:hypothetical protein
MMTKRVYLAALVLPALFLLGTLAGCSGLAALLPRKVAAEYSLPKKQKYAVFVDDYMAPSGSLNLKKTLAKAIGDAMIEGRVCREEDMVDVERVFDQPSDSPDGKKLSIQHIGGELGAAYVVYVNLIEFNLQSDPENPMIYPKARAYVKVIEVATGERLWPIDIAGYPIEAKDRMQGEVAAEADREEWTKKLTDLLAEDVAQLFYDHESR